MKKHTSFGLLVIVTLLLIATAVLSTQSNTSTPGQATPDQTAELLTRISTSTPMPFTGKLVRLAWFYKPPQEGQLDFLAENFDLFILTHKDESERTQLKTLGVESPISQYLLFLVISDPGECDKEPNGNQVAFKTGDFCQISDLHPDWFLLDQNGNRIRSGKSSYYMDPGSQGYRAFWLERARELQETYGWEMIFLDNVEASLTKMTSEDIQVAQYRDDASYQAAVEGFLEFIRHNYFEPRGKPMYGNIVSVAEDAVWDRYMQYLDGALVESFATSWSDGYPSVKAWEAEMTQTERALAQGKTLILVAQGDQADIELQQFAFASYLLISNGNTFFRYTNADAYREIWMYENYQFDLGIPLGNRYKVKESWRRDFTKGYVTVNPQDHKVEIVTTP